MKCLGDGCNNESLPLSSYCEDCQPEEDRHIIRMHECPEINGDMIDECAEVEVEEEKKGERS